MTLECENERKRKVLWREGERVQFHGLLLVWMCVCQSCDDDQLINYK